jgi:asparagine synthase (glutamine-hydrolysing)
MCGIAGIVNLADDRELDLALLERMSSRLRHRGPDDEGFAYVEHGLIHECSGASSVGEIARRLPPLRSAGEVRRGSVALAHRRYTVIDLSTNGHQPFLDRERRCAVILNGEIYNYVELRSELEALGHEFMSSSDTEVVALGWKAWGPDCFARMNGMWALAIYDRDTDSLIVSRDRVGKRPLYWANRSGAVYFASEIKALLEVPDLSAARAVHEAARSEYLRSGARDRQGATMFEGISTFPPAAWATVDASFPGNAVSFWRLPPERRSERDVSVDDAAREVRNVLRSAVEIRLRADVPWAIELSGGLDSSAITAVAAELSNGQAVAYTARWDEPEWNEEGFARSLAHSLGVRHIVVDPIAESIWDEILEFTYLQEEPYHSPNLHTSTLIARRIRGDGVRVSLNGAGGDELFAGYPPHFGLCELELLLRGSAGRAGANCREWSEAGPLRAAAQVVAAPARQLAGAAYRSARAARRGRSAPAAPWPSPGTIGERAAAPLSERLRRDFVNDLMPYWLRSGDKTQMGVPLEPRNPFLDYRMVELAFSLPISYLIRDGWQKWIVRKALEDLLPADVVWRRRKMGYPFPYRSFLERSRRIEEMIVSSVRPAGRSLSLFAGASPLARWRRLSFLLWYELFIEQRQELFQRIRLAADGDDAEPARSFRAEFLAQVP